MEFGAFDLKKIHVLRVDPGEDILAAVEQFIAAANLQQAVVMGGYGTMAGKLRPLQASRSLPKQAGFLTRGRNREGSRPLHHLPGNSSCSKKSVHPYFDISCHSFPDLSPIRETSLSKRNAQAA